MFNDESNHMVVHSLRVRAHTHTHTHTQTQGQYIKSVAPNGPADLAGMLPGDHVLAVDGVNVLSENHHKVREEGGRKKGREEGGRKERWRVGGRRGGGRKGGRG